MMEYNQQLQHICLATQPSPFFVKFIFLIIALPCMHLLYLGLFFTIIVELVAKQHFALYSFM